MTIQFIQTDNAAQSAAILAHAVAEDLRQILAKQPRATLAVSGGKSPVTFFQALNQEDLAWENVNITLVDERLVPINHTDSNTSLVRKYLLQNRAATAKWLPMIAEEATEDSLKNIPDAIEFAVKNFVQPDILILGMGADGHTASIFPQAPQLADAIRADYPQPLLHTTPVTASYERVSMTLAAIEKTANVYISIAGTEKFAVFNQAKDGITPKFPISYVLNSQKVEAHVIYND